jgi:hypothetical protein
VVVVVVIAVVIAVCGDRNYILFGVEELCTEETL